MSHSIRRCAMLLTVWGVATGCHVIADQERPARSIRLLPVNDAAGDASLVAFLAEMTVIAKGQNLEVLRSKMSPELANRQSFWFAPARGDIYWLQLQRILALGGTFTTTRGAVRGRREFCAPYVYSAFPFPAPEALASESIPSVVIVEGATVHALPSGTARVIATLSYDVVLGGGDGLRSQDKGDNTTWTQIQLTDGRQGFIRETQLRSTTDYHACFAQLDGRWQMVRFERGVVPGG